MPTPTKNYDNFVHIKFGTPSIMCSASKIMNILTSEESFPEFTLAQTRGNFPQIPDFFYFNNEPGKLLLHLSSKQQIDIILLRD